MSKDVTGEDVMKWAERYEQEFERPYPPFFSSYEEKVNDIKERIERNDPYPPGCNDPDRIY